MIGSNMEAFEEAKVPEPEPEPQVRTMTVLKLTEGLGLTEACIRVFEDIAGLGPNYYVILGDDSAFRSNRIAQRPQHAATKCGS